MTTPGAPQRDLRLDVFRGLALVCIFVDHIPGNRLGAYTLRNLGFSDASELFVFVSAYAAGLVYSSCHPRFGLGAVCRKAWTRMAEVYAAHLALLATLALFAGWLGRALSDPRFVQGLNVGPLLERPAAVALDVVTLTLQPVFMNVLPLYVALLAVVPLVIWMLDRSPGVTVALSAVVWLVARGALSRWFPATPGSTWQFDPLAWQLLFVVGMWLGARVQAGRSLPSSKMAVAVALAYVVWAFAIGDAAWGLDGGTLNWPPALLQLVFPVMERTDLSLWRLGHVLALAYLVTVVVTADVLNRSQVARALALCGRHSLALFSLGVLLSVAGWAALSHLGDTAVVQVMINLVGCLVMVAVAWLLSRLRTRAASVPGTDAPDSALSGVA